MADDPIWRQLADTAIAAELRVWRRAHPEATLTEIEQALDARLNAARAGLLAEVAADVPEEEERCPDCGERLARRGDANPDAADRRRRAAGTDPRLPAVPGLRGRAFPPSMSD